MIRKLVAAFVTILFAASIHATVFAAEDGNFKAGDVLRVTGMAAISPVDPLGKIHARQAARLDALRQLVEVTEGVSVYPESDERLESLLNPKRIVSRISCDGKVFKLLEKNARVIDEKFFINNEGTSRCEVTMELVFPTDWKIEKIDIQPFPVPDWKND